MNEAQVLQAFTALSEVGTDQLLSAIEQWEQDYIHYTDRTGEDISDNMRKACLQSMCPTELPNHIDMNILRLNTYAILKAEVERYIEQVATREGPTPMDIGSLLWNTKGNKGTGRSKGQGSKGKANTAKGAGGSASSGPSGGKGGRGGLGPQQFQGYYNRC